MKGKLKYTYNKDKRIKKGKNVRCNSGNYIALQSTFSSKQKNVTNIENPPNDTLLTEIHWGMQRSLGGQWLFNVNFGLGYAKDFDTELNQFYPAIGLAFSYVIF